MYVSNLSIHRALIPPSCTRHFTPSRNRLPTFMKLCVCVAGVSFDVGRCRCSIASRCTPTTRSQSSMSSRTRSTAIAVSRTCCRT